MVEQQVRLRALQPVHLGDDGLVADVAGRFEHGRVIVADTVVVVVEPVDLAEPDVDRVALGVPVGGDGLLVGGAQYGLPGDEGCRILACGGH